jgi:hypothetical protein
MFTPPNQAYAQFQAMLQVDHRSTAPKNFGRGTMFNPLMVSVLLCFNIQSAAIISLITALR